jgi:hypothetical protein
VDERNAMKMQSVRRKNVFARINSRMAMVLNVVQVSINKHAEINFQ